MRMQTSGTFDVCLVAAGVIVLEDITVHNWGYSHQNRQNLGGSGCHLNPILTLDTPYGLKMATTDGKPSTTERAVKSK